MFGRLLVFLFLISVTASAQQQEEDYFPPARKIKSYSDSRFFYSIGTEWFSFFCYGRTEEGLWNYTANYLPTSINMEFRQNIIERDSAHSFSVAFAPQFGFALFTTSNDAAEHAAFPVFFQYNWGLQATHRYSEDDIGHSIGIGPSLNLVNTQYNLYMLSNFIAVDFQYTKYQLTNKETIKFHYVRFGIDPSGGMIPDRGFHFNFGVGRTF